MTQGLWRAAASMLVVGLLAACATVAPPPVVHHVATAPSSKAHRQGRLFYHVLLGDIAGQQGRLGAAAQAFGEAARETGNLGLTRRSTLLSLYARRYAQAHYLARLWLSLAPKSASAREALADADLGLNRTQAAVQQFERALAQAAAAQGSAGRAFAFEHIATLLLRHKRVPPTLMVMQALTQRYPKDPIGAYALADLARQDHDQATALRAIDAALALKPDWEGAAVLKARILWSAAPRRALAFSARFLKSNPSATRLRLDYARRLVSLEYWHRALAQFRVIAAAAPNDARVLYAAGLIALRSDDLGLARSYLKRSLALAPGDPRAELYLGEIAQKQNRFARAHYYYARVGAPYRFTASMRDGLMLLQESAPRLAWQRLARVAAHTPAQITALALARNEVLMAMGHYAQGLALLKAVTPKSPHPNVLLYARALDEEKSGAVAAAEQDLEHLVAAHPHSAVALNALGYTYINHHQHEKRGMALVRRALALDPKNPDILDSMGWAYYRTGHPRLALPYLRRAFLLSRDPTIAAHLGAALWRAGEHGRALRLWRAALTKAPHNAVLKAELAKHSAL
ncbi:MAG: tetratricopeptide repeat protein [Acidiferrobacter sp.]